MLKWMLLSGTYLNITTPLSWSEARRFWRRWCACRRFRAVGVRAGLTSPAGHDFRYALGDLAGHRTGTGGWPGTLPVTGPAAAPCIHHGWLGRCGR